MSSFRLTIGLTVALPILIMCITGTLLTHQSQIQAWIDHRGLQSHPPKPGAAPVQHQGGGTKENAALQPAEREDTYPEPGMFGTMPSHGFYIRHVKGIQFDNIDMQPAKEDQRPALVLDQVEQADFSRIKTPRVAGVPLFALTKVPDFNVRFCGSVADTHVEQTEQQTIR